MPEFLDLIEHLVMSAFVVDFLIAGTIFVDEYTKGTRDEWMRPVSRRDRFHAFVGLAVISLTWPLWLFVSARESDATEEGAA